jgi:hypothetical protein
MEKFLAKDGTNGRTRHPLEKIQISGKNSWKQL